MRRNRRLLIGFAMVLLLVIFLTSVYVDTFRNERMQENIDLRMQEISMPNVLSFHMQMTEQIEKLNTLADFFGKTGVSGNDMQLDLMRSSVEQNGLLRSALLLPDGSFITHDSTRGSAVGEPFFDAAMQGRFTISEPRYSILNPNKLVILFTSPIYQGGKGVENAPVIGALTHIYLCENIETIFHLSLMNGQGRSFVIKPTGELLIGMMPGVATHENLLALMRANCTHEKHAVANCLRTGSDARSMTITPTDGRGGLRIHLDPLDYNDWQLLSILPESVGFDIYADLVREQRILGAVAFLCAMAYGAAVLWVTTMGRRHIDQMTGLPTLELFKARAKKRMRTYPNKRFVFVKLDVRNLKIINRIYDFETGDQVIKSLAESLQIVLSGVNATYARTGTDVFLLMIEYHSRERLNVLREEFLYHFRRLMGKNFTTTVEMPTGQYVTTAEDAAKPDIPEILEKINFAHRAAKQRQTGSIIVDYEANIEKDAIFRKEIEDKMLHALENDEFKLYLQPKYDVVTEQICGAEALVRWTVDGEIFLHPTSFIPVLERNGFIVKIDMHMFRHAVRKLREILDQKMEPIVISVNFSRCHLANENFVKELCEIADAYAVPHQYLEVELTESIVFDNISRIIALADQLHAAGFALSMDDFGSGYSCLGLLKNIDVDVIKIDKCFFEDNFSGDRAQIVIANVLRMAQELEVQTVAEGVETYEQVKLLRELGCNMIQGYYYARPMPADALDLRRIKEHVI